MLWIGRSTVDLPRFTSLSTLKWVFSEPIWAEVGNMASDLLGWRSEAPVFLKEDGPQTFAYQIYILS